MLTALMFSAALAADPVPLPPLDPVSPVEAVIEETRAEPPSRDAYVAPCSRRLGPTADCPTSADFWRAAGASLGAGLGAGLVVVPSLFLFSSENPLYNIPGGTLFIGGLAVGAPAASAAAAAAVMSKRTDSDFWTPAIAGAAAIPVLWLPLLYPSYLGAIGLSGLGTYGAASVFYAGAALITAPAIALGATLGARANIRRKVKMNVLPQVGETNGIAVNVRF